MEESHEILQVELKRVEKIEAPQILAAYHYGNFALREYLGDEIRPGVVKRIVVLSRPLNRFRFTPEDQVCGNWNPGNGNIAISAPTSSLDNAIAGKFPDRPQHEKWLSYLFHEMGHAFFSQKAGQADNSSSMSAGEGFAEMIRMVIESNGREQDIIDKFANELFLPVYPERRNHVLFTVGDPAMNGSDMRFHDASILHYVAREFGFQTAVDIVAQHPDSSGLRLWIDALKKGKLLKELVVQKQQRFEYWLQEKLGVSLKELSSNSYAWYEQRRSGRITADIPGLPLFRKYNTVV